MTYFIGVLTLANTFIALFILVYSWHFLRETVKQKSRKPWDLLFTAALFYLFYQILSLIAFYTPDAGDITNYKILLELLFSGLVLYTFVTQHDLIHHSPKIIIRRKKKRK